MPISRDEVIETLDALAAPLGPFTSHGDRLERQDRWVDDSGVELLEVLVALVASPPGEDQLRHASLDDWSTLLVEVAGTLGKRHPEVALQRLLPLLEEDRARAAAIDILGSVGDARTVPELGRLMRSRRLGEDDLVHLAGALGEIGGDEACRLLAQLRQTVTPGQGELRQEIEIAVQAARCE
jgi:HEAT repeat protein